MRLRIVIDTNVYISRYLLPDSVPGRAVCKIWQEHRVLTSNPALEELSLVLHRKKFARYVQSHSVQEFLSSVRLASEIVPIPSPIHACRDPRDDKFLEVAVHGRAHMILTGDDDLLALNPFQGIEILTPAEFLAQI